MKGKTMPLNLDDKFDVDGQHGFIVFENRMERNPSNTVARAARTSYGKENSEKPTEGTIAKLADEEHTSPFRHSPISLTVQCPEFVARQWWKHIVGGEYSFKDTGWNEISGRYIEYDKIYVPPTLYRKARISKLGSSGDAHERSAHWVDEMERLTSESVELYHSMVRDGVAKEQARAMLPMSFYTRFMWTASEQALFHFVRLRTAPDAQREIREYAAVVDHICSQHYGISWKELVESSQKWIRIDDPNYIITRKEGIEGS
jgi:thymidylate synthase (FAD)